MGALKKVLIGFLLVGLALATFAGISYAADKSGTNSPTSGFIAGCRGFFGGAAAEVSKLLGLSPDKIVEKRKAGESLADIAKDQGVSKDKLIDTIIEARKKILDERVKAGVITQENENAILERMKANITARVQNPALGPGARRGGCGCNGGGPGACPGFRGGLGPGAGTGYWGNPPATQSKSNASISNI